MNTMILNAESVTCSHTAMPMGFDKTTNLETRLGDKVPAERPRQRFFVHETVEIELPSEVRFINAAVSYLVERAFLFGIVYPESSNLVVALSEALSNAVIHGNGNDPAKRVRVRAEFSAHEALFTVSDEGHGFDLASVPDPREGANLFRPSGRGLLLIHRLMDKVFYHGRGNVVTMIKYSESQK